MAQAIPSMSLSTGSNVLFNGTATTAAPPGNTEAEITLEPDTVIITPTQSLSTPQAVMYYTISETTWTSEMDASYTSKMTSSSLTLGNSQTAETSTSTSASSVSSSGRSLISISIQGTSPTIRTNMSTSASSIIHQPIPTPPTASSESNPSDNTYSPMMIASMVIAGCFVSALFMIIMWLLWKRIFRSRRSNVLYAAGRSRQPWTRDPQRLGDSRLASFPWEECHDGVEDNSSLFQKSITSMTAYEPGLSNGLFDKHGYHETVEMRRQSLDRLARRNHSLNGTIRNSISSWTGTVNPGAFTVPNVTTSPRSILKMSLLANTHGMTRLASPTQDDPIRGSAAKAIKILGWEGSDGLIAVAKKEVRFGETQVKEFGRTPFSSTANSVTGDMKDLPDKP